MNVSKKKKKMVQNLSYVSGLSLFLGLVKARVSNLNCQKDTLKSGNFCFCKIFLHLFRQMLKKMSYIFIQQIQIEIYLTKFYILYIFSGSFSPRKVLKFLEDFAKWVERSEMTEETLPRRNYNSTVRLKFKGKQHPKRFGPNFATKNNNVGQNLNTD